MRTHDERSELGLESMPPVPPAPELWPRLDLERRRRINRLRAGVGTAAILLLCVALLPLLGESGSPPAPAPLAAASQTTAAPQAALDEDTLEQIRALDRALQTAYDQGASDDEVEPLWRARQALVPRQASSSRATTTSSNQS